jgi:hypothetical protein
LCTILSLASAAFCTILSLASESRVRFARFLNMLRFVHDPLAGFRFVHDPLKQAREVSEIASLHSK